MEHRFHVSHIRDIPSANIKATDNIIFRIYIISKTIFLGVDTPGYASTMAVILFLGSVQLISIGVLGEYIGRIFMEVKRRPVYVINEIEGGRTGTGFIKSGTDGAAGESGNRKD